MCEDIFSQVHLQKSHGVYFGVISPQAWSPGQVVFLRCNFQQVQSSQDGRGAKTKEWERGVWQGEKTTAVVRESASRQPGLLVHASLVVRPRRRGRVVWLPDQGTLLPAPLLSVQILSNGGPAFQENMGVILKMESFSGTHFSEFLRIKVICSSQIELLAMASEFLRSSFPWIRLLFIPRTSYFDHTSGRNSEIWDPGK